jgi:hypothetical protein
VNKELQVEYDNVAALVEELVPPDEDSLVRLVLSSSATAHYFRNEDTARIVLRWARTAALEEFQETA